MQNKLLTAIFAWSICSYAQQFTVVERGPHHRTFEKTSERVLPGGVVTTEKERYIELATGMHYKQGEQWLETREEVEIVNDNAVARQGPHQVIWNSNANSPGAIDLLTDSGRFRSHVIGIALTDRASGASAMIAEIKDSVGVVVGANQVIYPDAFDGIKASIRYTYTRAGLEQDILLEEAPRPVDEYLPGVDPATVRLEVYTEFIEAPPAAVQLYIRKEAPADLRQAMVFPDVTDHSLDFGSVHIGSGHAFLTEAQLVSSDRVVVQKEWAVLENRQFLVESVELAEIEPLLRTLPLTAGLNPGQRARRVAKLQPGRRSTVAELLPAAPLKKPSIARMQFAAARPTKPALVLDYFTLNSSQTNYLFSSVETYRITGAVNLYGASNIMEGGTVIKYSPGVGAKIDIKGTLWFDTDLYRPVVFTSDRDSTMGQSITSGSLAGADIALRFDYNTSGQLAAVTNIKVLYANKALEFAGGRGHDVRHVQLVNVGTAAHADAATVHMRNILGWNLTNALTGGSSSTSTGRWEHATFDQATNLVTTATGFFTNCLLTGVVTTNGLAGVNNVVLASSNGVYKTVGSAYHYLVDSSPYRDAGTTNINSGLRNELGRRTTYAPISLDPVTNNLTLNPQASRETGIPDVGFYYAPLDYYASGVLVSSNATVLATNGATVGLDLANGWGIRLKSSSFHSVGSPTAFNYVGRAHMAQEKSGGNPGTRACFRDEDTVGSATAELRLRFTEFSQASFDGYLYYIGTKSRALEFTHSRLYTPWLNLSISAVNGPVVCGFTNSLWERGTLDITRSGSASTNIQVHLRNNLMRTGGIFFRSGSMDWTVKDNLFDRLTHLMDTGSAISNSYNAYFQIANGYSLSGGVSNIALTNLTYQTGALGIYYQPTNSLLINAGSRTADLAGLYHWTTTTNNVKETNSVVDIGIHYVAAPNGIPSDADGDGIPDYLEDTDGDGSWDSGVETDWNDADTDNDGVSDFLEWVQRRNQGAGATNDLNGIINLRVYTPLK